MNHQKIRTPIAVFLLLSLLVLALAQFFGVSWRDIGVGIFTYLLYGLLIAAFFLRFALIFVGVFAVYRAFRERHYRQHAA